MKGGVALAIKGDTRADRYGVTTSCGISPSATSTKGDVGVGLCGFKLVSDVAIKGTLEAFQSIFVLDMRCKRWCSSSYQR